MERAWHANAVVVPDRRRRPHQSDSGAARRQRGRSQANHRSSASPPLDIAAKREHATSVGESMLRHSKSVSAVLGFASYNPPTGLAVVPKRKHSRSNTIIIASNGAVARSRVRPDRGSSSPTSQRPASLPRGDQHGRLRITSNHHVLLLCHSASRPNTKYQRSVCAGWARKSFGGSAACAPDSAACAPDSADCAPDSAACAPDSAACHRDSAACVPESATRFGDSPGGLRAGSMVVIASNRRLPSVALFLSLCQMTYRVCRRRSVAPLCCFLT